MRSRVARAWSDTLLSAGVLVLVLLALMALDIRVREQIRMAITSNASIDAAGNTVGEFGSVLFDAAKNQSIDHGPMMIFIAAAVVLVLFMMRT